MITLIEYPKCSTCRNAKKWLESNSCSFQDRNIVTETPTKEELKQFLDMSRYPVKKFFNTSGNLYKEFGLKDKLETMSEEEKLDILSKHGMLIKRPMLITENKVLLGFKENEWEELIK